MKVYRATHPKVWQCLYSVLDGSVIASNPNYVSPSPLEGIEIETDESTIDLLETELTHEMVREVQRSVYSSYPPLEKILLKFSQGLGLE